MRDDNRRGSRRKSNSTGNASRSSPKENTSENARRESGEPGGGQGRRDEVGPTGVYPMSGGIPEGKHLEIRTPASWGQGDRGAAGYEDSGGSELVWRDGQLLGGLTSGPSGEPTIDIHGGDRPPTSQDTAQEGRGRKNENDKNNKNNKNETKKR
jgi:hypothetical protein